ncbi:MAG TPA: hypothetical protein VLE89_08100 [Chlamydiales bacterium]|nr:hypothetical protein [Chlamydiales bacterium]
MSATAAAPAAVQATQQQTPTAPADKGRYTPLNRCEYGLATVVNIVHIAKSILMALILLIAAGVCLGKNKKINGYVHGHATGISAGLVGLILSITGIFCPNYVNNTLGRKSD